MNETGFWNSLRDSCAGTGAHLVRVENAIAEGTPDVNGCWRGAEFWWELKYLEGWPKRARTPVRIPHYTKEQRLWLLARGQAGGSACLLLRVGKQVLLFNWFYAQAVGSLIRDHLLSTAMAVWDGPVDPLELLTLSTNGGLVILARADLDQKNSSLSSSANANKRIGLINS